jgi:chromate transporter
MTIAVEEKGSAIPTIPFAEAFRVWLKIGFTSFGGPAGQIAMMHKMLVEDRKWIGEERFLHALNYCMLLPGPEAQQLAIYIGWLLHRTWGGIVAGTLFVLPGFLLIVLLSALYAGLGELGPVQAIFFGLKAAVLAVVIEALLRISKRALRSRVMYFIAGAAFVAIFALHVPFPVVVAAAALIGFAGSRFLPQAFVPAAARPKAGQAIADRLIETQALPHTAPSSRRAATVLLICGLLWFGPLLAVGQFFGWGHIFAQQSIFFSKMAVVTFGGAYAVLAYVAQQAVERFAWLSADDMLSGLALAETTPGPLILVLTFVGFVAAFRAPGAMDPYFAGLIGATLTTWMTFTPCFLWIFLGAPYVEAIRGVKILSAGLAAITAAVVGVVLNLTIWFAVHVLFAEVRDWQGFGMTLPLPNFSSLDPWAAVIAAGAGLALLRFHVPMIPTLGASAAAGLLVFALR